MGAKHMQRDGEMGIFEGYGECDEEIPPEPRSGKFKHWYVNVYLIDKSYGGPEEGGWWFDTGEIIRIIPCSSKKKAHRTMRLVELVVTKFNEGRRPISSVLSKGVLEAIISQSPGQNYPSQRPHYE